MTEDWEFENKPWLALDSKLWQAVNAGRKVRIRMPCDEEVWKDLLTLCKAGQIELVVRKPKNER